LADAADYQRRRHSERLCTAPKPILAELPPCLKKDQIPQLTSHCTSPAAVAAHSLPQSRERHFQQYRSWPVTSSNSNLGSSWRLLDGSFRNDIQDFTVAAIPNLRSRRDL
jgi:hypothetical protein